MAQLCLGSISSGPQSIGVMTHVYGSAQYSENIVDTMLITIASFVGSVAVTSIKTFFVFKVILLSSELMIGGIDRTWSSESYMIG